MGDPYAVPHIIFRESSNDFADDSGKRKRPTTEMNVFVSNFFERKEIKIKWNFWISSNIGRPGLPPIGEKTRIFLRRNRMGRYRVYQIFKKSFREQLQRFKKKSKETVKSNFS